MAELKKMAGQAPRRVEEEQSRREPRSSSNPEPPYLEAQVHAKPPQRRQGSEAAKMNGPAH